MILRSAIIMKDMRHASTMNTPGMATRISSAGEGVECFIDELAHAANKDSFEYRRVLLSKSPRLKRALELAATKAGRGMPFEKGGVKQSNFDDCPMLRIDEMPKVEVHIVPSVEAVGGVGEPGVPPIAPAVANAVFAATGKRIRKLPIQLNA